MPAESASAASFWYASFAAAASFTAASAWALACATLAPSPPPAAPRAPPRCTLPSFRYLGILAFELGVRQRVGLLRPRQILRGVGGAAGTSHFVSVRAL